ncbi:MAG: hypothetical protein HFI42_11495 [Lachnospiraceae bacterium]|nr:hypothetical protein [Lachnospiraceae bacterium]
MNRVGSYGYYQKSTYDSTVRKDQAEKAAGSRTQKTSDQKEVKLSYRAQELLKELQKTYKNMDFMVAEYETDEEASEYLSRGTKDYSVLIDPEELEKMAADEDHKKKNLALLDEATGKLDEMKKQLGDDGEEVKHLGITIGSDGTVSFFAELEQMSEKQQERIEKGREAKRQEKAEAAKADQRKDPYRNYGKTTGKHATVKADTMEELLDKIRNFDWSTVKKETEQASGSRFDTSI